MLIYEQNRMVWHHESQILSQSNHNYYLKKAPSFYNFFSFLRSTFLPKLSWIWRWFPRSCVHLHPFLIWYWYLAPGKPINYARKMAILKGGFWDFTIEKPKTIIVNGYFSSIINGFSGGKVSISNQEWMQMNTWT